MWVIAVAVLMAIFPPWLMDTGGDRPFTAGGYAPIFAAPDYHGYGIDAVRLDAARLDYGRLIVQYIGLFSVAAVIVAIRERYRCYWKGIKESVLLWIPAVASVMGIWTTIIIAVHPDPTAQLEGHFLIAYIAAALAIVTGSISLIRKSTTPFPTQNIPEGNHSSSNIDETGPMPSQSSPWWKPISLRAQGFDASPLDGLMTLLIIILLIPNPFDTEAWHNVSYFDLMSKMVGWVVTYFVIPVGIAYGVWTLCPRTKRMARIVFCICAVVFFSLMQLGEYRISKTADAQQSHSQQRQEPATSRFGDPLDEKAQQSSHSQEDGTDLFDKFGKEPQRQESNWRDRATVVEPQQPERKAAPKSNTNRFDQFD